MSSTEQRVFLPPWRPMSTAPDDVPVLVLTENGQRVAQKLTAAEDGSVAWVYARRLGAEPIAFVCEPTAWMPTPPVSIPASWWWREEGKADPHGRRYDCERGALIMGHLTDDQMANAVFLDPGIAHLTAAKDRIRWLSRALTRALEDAEVARNDVCSVIEDTARELGCRGDNEAILATASALRQAVARLHKVATQALGIIVEFGDLNGFRETTNEELGKLVVGVAKALAAELTRVQDAGLATPNPDALDSTPPNPGVFRDPGFENWPKLLRDWIGDERLTYDQHTRFLVDDLRRLLGWIEAAMKAPRVTEAMVDRLLAVQPATMSMWPGRIEDLRRENARRMLEGALRCHVEDPTSGGNALDMPLPVTIVLPGVIFRRGVSLGTLVLAAARWKKIANEALSAQLDPMAVDRLRALLIAEPGPEPTPCSACGGTGDGSAAPAPEPCQRCGGDGIEP